MRNLQQPQTLPLITSPVSKGIFRKIITILCAQNPITVDSVFAADNIDNYDKTGQHVSPLKSRSTTNFDFHLRPMLNKPSCEDIADSALVNRWNDTECTESPKLDEVGFLNISTITSHEHTSNNNIVNIQECEMVSSKKHVVVYSSIRLSLIEMIDICINRNICPEKTNTVIPQGSSKNAVFVIDTSYVNICDITTDGLIYGKRSGRKQMVRAVFENGTIMNASIINNFDANAAVNSNDILLMKRHYGTCNSNKVENAYIKRTITTFKNIHTKTFYRYAIIKYTCIVPGLEEIDLDLFSSFSSEC